ncbi:uncharacterized protein [Phyllobates terribilis]|uniref:uncharacterized protein n=1 Tax=Phyllobates terribilis TaxID=111132 RepID=UPI003CCAD1DA
MYNAKKISVFHLSNYHMLIIADYVPLILFCYRPSCFFCLINKERCSCVEMKNLNLDTGDVLSSLLDLAANNDVEGFKRSAECDPSTIDEVGLWYCRQKGSKQMIFEHRTPLMVAAMYGSVDVVTLILSLSLVDVNRSCGLDKSTALHCAASGGSSNSVDVVKLLLKSGADIHSLDINGHRPLDVINTPPKLQSLSLSLEELLSANGSSYSSSSSSTESPPSPITTCPSSEKKEYPIDPSIPDIKNGIYSTDEFRMYQFKVRPCSRAYSHDWTECPFVHPGENARRRDPRKYHYSCVPCPDFRKGACKRADMCEYAHGVFECWLHPAQYRTRLCKDGTACNRRVCFFAHTPDELRPLYTHSPRASSNFMPGSPSSVMSPSTFTPPMSPSFIHEVPSLRLPGTRLRSSLNARDMDFRMLSEFDQHQHQNRLLTELSLLSLSGSSRSLRPSNLDELFSSESSPRYGGGSPMSARFASVVGPREMQLHQLRNLNAREVGPNISAIVGSPVHSCRMRRSSSFESNGEEPDLSWVQSLVKEEKAMNPPQQFYDCVFTGEQNYMRTTEARGFVYPIPSQIIKGKFMSKMFCLYSLVIVVPDSITYQRQYKGPERNEGKWLWSRFRRSTKKVEENPLITFKINVEFYLDLEKKISYLVIETLNVIEFDRLDRSV